MTEIAFFAVKAGMNESADKSRGHFGIGKADGAAQDQIAWPGKISHDEGSQPPVSAAKVGNILIFLQQSKRKMRHVLIVCTLKQSFSPFIFIQYAVSIVNAHLTSGIDAILPFPKLDQPCASLIIKVYGQTVEDHAKAWGDMVVKRAVAERSLPCIDSGGKNILRTNIRIAEGTDQII